MPKLKHKRASSALCARQAKKRKRNQREREQRAQHETRQHQHSCSHPSSEASSEERRRELNAVVHRSARLDPERRQQEQERDTAARKQLRINNPERRQEEQVCTSISFGPLISVLI